MPVFDKNNSRIKMRIFTQNGHPNTAWYSREREESKKDDYALMDAMFARFQNHKTLPQITQAIIFYDNKSGVELRKYTPTS